MKEQCCTVGSLARTRLKRADVQGAAGRVKPLLGRGSCHADLPAALAPCPCTPRCRCTPPTLSLSNAALLVRLPPHCRVHYPPLEQLWQAQERVSGCYGPTPCSAATAVVHSIADAGEHGDGQRDANLLLLTHDSEKPKAESQRKPEELID